MLLKEKLENKNIILASGSPRRQQFIRDLGLHYKIQLKKVEENYPENLTGKAIAEHLSKVKAEAYLKELTPKDLLITGDTVVWFEHQILHKPKNRNEARQMLKNLSGKMHQVFSSCCITSTEKQEVVTGETKVFFEPLTKEEILYYTAHFTPYDKAGAYGIQEWIGKIGIQRIEGSFYNVMGMPISKVYHALLQF